MMFHVTLEPAEDGWIVAECPALPGCVSQGRDEKEALENIREAITARRAQIFYLPPDSPDMNPIELAFSKLKALLRQEPARTVDALVDRIGQLLDRFLPAECANFFLAAGYQRSI